MVVGVSCLFWFDMVHRQEVALGLGDLSPAVLQPVSSPYLTLLYFFVYLFCSKLRRQRLSPALWMVSLNLSCLSYLVMTLISGE